MDEQMLLLVSVAVFGLMVMGLILTIREFKQMDDESASRDQHDQKYQAGLLKVNAVANDRNKQSGRFN